MQVFSCEVCGICWNTFFKEHHRTTACDYSSISSREWRIGKRNCELRYKSYSMCTNLSRKCKLLKRAVQMKEQVSEVVADFKLKNFVNSTGKHLCWSLFLIKSIKERLQHWCFTVKFAKFWRTPFFTEQLQWLLQSVFSKEPGKKTDATVVINTKFSKKSICCRENPEAATVGVLKMKACIYVRQRLQYCGVFKITYFEKHLWTAVFENQHLSDKLIKGR